MELVIHEEKRSLGRLKIRWKDIKTGFGNPVDYQLIGNDTMKSGVSDLIFKMDESCFFILLYSQEQKRPCHFRDLHKLVFLI
jgi:hypothetical protein